MIEIVELGPNYKHAVVNTTVHNFVPYRKEFDSLDSHEFSQYQNAIIYGSTHRSIPDWSVDGIRLVATDEDVGKIDTQFINIPRTLNSKTRYYTGDMALFIILNYQVNL